MCCWLVAELAVVETVQTRLAPTILPAHPAALLATLLLLLRLSLGLMLGLGLRLGLGLGFPAQTRAAVQYMVDC